MFTEKEQKEIVETEFITPEMKQMLFMAKGLEYLYNGERAVIDDMTGKCNKLDDFKAKQQEVVTAIHGLIAERITAVTSQMFCSLIDGRVY